MIDTINLSVSSLTDNKYGNEQLKPESKLSDFEKLLYQNESADNYSVHYDEKKSEILNELNEVRFPVSKENNSYELETITLVKVDFYIDEPDSISEVIKNNENHLNEMLLLEKSNLLKDLSDSSYLTVISSNEVGIYSSSNQEINKPTISFTLFPDGSFKLIAIGVLEQISQSDGLLSGLTEKTKIVENAPSAIGFNQNKITVDENIPQNQKSLKLDLANFERNKVYKKYISSNEDKNLSKYIASNEWQELLRKLTLIKNTDGMEIYLRDYHLTEEQHKSVVQEIKDSLNGNIRIKNILINGKRQNSNGG